MIRRLNEYPLFTGHTRCMLFVVIGKTNYFSKNINSKKRLPHNSDAQPCAVGGSDGYLSLPEGGGADDPLDPRMPTVQRNNNDKTYTFILDVPTSVSSGSPGISSLQPSSSVK